MAHRRSDDAAKSFIVLDMRTKVITGRYDFIRKREVDQSCKESCQDRWSCCRNVVMGMETSNWHLSKRSREVVLARMGWVQAERKRSYA